MKKYFVLLIVLSLIASCLPYSNDLHVIKIEVDRPAVNIYVSGKKVNDSTDTQTDKTTGEAEVISDCLCNQIMVSSDSTRTYYSTIILEGGPDIIEKKIETVPLTFNTNPELKFLISKVNFIQGDSIGINHHEYAARNGQSRSFDHNITYSDSIYFHDYFFYSDLKELMVKMNFMDSSWIFLDPSSTVRVSGQIKQRETWFNYGPRSGRFISDRYNAKIKVQWAFTDYYNDTLFTFDDEAGSGVFCLSQTNLDNAITSVDALKNSLLNAMKSKKAQELMQNGLPDNAEQYTWLELKTDHQLPGSLQDAVESTVTIKHDDFHCSGFAVSTDGMIITAYHMIADEKDYKIILNDGSEHECELVRYDKKKNLALLKTDAVFKRPFLLPDKENVKNATQVYAIGTPKNIELGQSLSKGIISGVREKGNMRYIQTDAKTNYGNSGGPLIYKNSELVGIVVTKMYGFSVEGLTFSIPASDIRESLKLK